MRTDPAPLPAARFDFTDGGAGCCHLWTTPEGRLAPRCRRDWEGVDQGSLRPRAIAPLRAGE